MTDVVGRMGIGWFRGRHGAAIPVLGLLLLGGAACRVSAPLPPTAPETATPTTAREATAAPEPTRSLQPELLVIDIEGFAFVPQEVTISVGGSVTWVMRDRGTTHTVTIEDSASGVQFDERLETGESFQYTFDEAGVFRYFCRIHPDTPAMHSIIRVQAVG